MASSDDRFQNTFCFEKFKEKIEARPTSTRSNIIFEKKTELQASNQYSSTPYANCWYNAFFYTVLHI